MDFDSLVDDSASQSQGLSPNVQASSDKAPDVLPNFDQLQDDSEKYSTTGQQIATGVEGLAKGVLGPIATAAELGLSRAGLPGVTAEDIKGREEANPGIHGVAEATGLVGSLFTGVGEAGLIASGAEHLLPEGVSFAGKIGSGILKGAIENGLIQGGNDLSDAMLGKGDPEAPVASALGHMGAAALLGGGIGGVLGGAAVGLSKLSEAKVSTNAAKFIDDFGSRWKFNQENPDLTEAITKELTDFHETTAEAADEVYGATGLKAKAIEKLVPPMNDAISSQSQEISNRLQTKISEMIQDPESFPTRLTKKLVQDANEWMEVATSPDATSNDIFNATQSLKQRLQAYSKFDKEVGPLSAEKDFISVTKELQHDLVRNLEDNKVWGEAGDLQKGVNKAFSEFLAPLKDFRSKFTTKIQGVPTVDPGKVSTYVKQLGSPRDVLKQQVISDYLKAAEKYRSEIEALHHSVGVESPLAPAALNAIHGTLNRELPAGAKLADDMFHAWIPSFSLKAGSTISGSEIGYHMGGAKGAAAGFALGMLAPKITQVAQRTLTKTAVPAALKVLSSGSGRGLLRAIDYAADVDRGALKISRGVDSLFKAGAITAVEEGATEKQREKLKQFIENGQLNKQIQDELGKKPTAPSPAPRAFAKGGVVEKRQQQLEPQSVTTNDDPIAEHFPTQNVMLQAAKGRINNYLNSIRPQENLAKLPFDKAPQDKQKAREYDKAIDLANQPLTILNKIKNGSITNEEKKHFVSLYPELYNHLSKKITERISKAQMADEMPSYKTRQAMSLFLGAPLESSLSPSGIQAAQMTFMKAKQGAAPQPSGNRRGTATLGKASKSYMTGDQARQERQNKV